MATPTGAVPTPNPATSCDTCGTWTGMDTGLCGTCAENWNERDQEAGLRSINRRRKANGLPPLERKG